jgi:hypothetical protein
MRAPAHSTWLRVFPAVLCITSLAAIIRADEPPKPPPGEVRLDIGRVVNCTFHFDRNSLQASVRVGDSLIALSSSGGVAAREKRCQYGERIYIYSYVRYYGSKF